MSEAVQKLYVMQAGDHLTADECAQINEGLAGLQAAQVPPEQADNVVSYLDRQFLFAQVEASLEAKLRQLV